MVHQSPTSLQKDTNVEDRDFIPSTHGLKTCFHWPWIWGVCTNEADEARFVYLSTFAWFSSPPYWFVTYDFNAWSALWNHLWFHPYFFRCVNTFSWVKRSGCVHPYTSYLFWFSTWFIFLKKRTNSGQKKVVLYWFFNFSVYSGLVF